ncbi:reverse transcriptase [Plakobranchus ocellatus]|uniref:Reverse transcriptase n=1 Tax=Plakobranchus ocellatus TaxID=259542 RepID=A0AAV3ZZ27_9GAST|nr:reverse transcriptase [Plakobranchus ocellatus]
MDSWLPRFERFAETSQWPRQKWVSSLSVVPAGRALDCYGRLPQAQALDYGEKKALIKRDDLIAGGYPRKFRIWKLEERESVDMSLDKTYLSPKGRAVRHCANIRGRKKFVRRRIMYGCLAG